MLVASMSYFSLEYSLRIYACLMDVTAIYTAYDTLPICHDGMLSYLIDLLKEGLNASPLKNTNGFK